MTEYGVVTAWLEPVVPLVVRGATGVERQVTALVDTGFSGELTLPADVVAALGLVRLTGEDIRLADGSVHSYERYTAQALWGGEWVEVRVSALGGEVLMGMALLAGRGLWVEGHPGGAVEVRPLPANGDDSTSTASVESLDRPPKGGGDERTRAATNAPSGVPSHVRVPPTTPRAGADGRGRWAARELVAPVGRGAGRLRACRRLV